jgi:SRSO17 transposase
MTVSRQWLGRLGKVDNGQVAVYGALCHGERSVLVDTRLYLPKEWIEDPQRCRQAGVPEEEIQNFAPRTNWPWKSFNTLDPRD